MKTLKDTSAIGKQIQDGVRLMGRGAEHIKWPIHLEKTESPRTLQFSLPEKLCPLSNFHISRTTTKARMKQQMKQRGLVSTQEMLRWKEEEMQRWKLEEHKASSGTVRAKQAVEAAGGSVRRVYYNKLGFEALLKPEWFDKKGRLLPKAASSPPKQRDKVDGIGRLPAPTKPIPFLPEEKSAATPLSAA